MTSIRVAVNSRRRGADGEQVERTDWFRVRTMGSKAEYMQRFTKGQRVLVIGRLEISEWQTREGETRTSYDIWADDVINLSPRDDGPRGQGNRRIQCRTSDQRGPLVRVLGELQLRTRPTST